MTNTEITRTAVIGDSQVQVAIRQGSLLPTADGAACCCCCCCCSNRAR